MSNHRFAPSKKRWRCAPVPIAQIDAAFLMTGTRPGELHKFPPRAPEPWRRQIFAMQDWVSNSQAEQTQRSHSDVMRFAPERFTASPIVFKMARECSCAIAPLAWRAEVDVRLATKATLLPGSSEMTRWAQQRT
jgi:hypothetical protein